MTSLAPPQHPGPSTRHRRDRSSARSSGRLGDASRPITPRSTLPAGRAVVGGLLVTLAAVGVLVTYLSSNGAPTTSYLIARQPIDAGQVIRSDDLREEPIDLPSLVAAQSFTAGHQLDGSIALVPITEGQLLARSGIRLVDDDAPDGAVPERQFSFAVERARALDGQIERGERIDLLATYGGSADATTVVVARDVPVVRISEQGKGGIGGGGALTLTIAVADADVVTSLAHATSVGAVTVVRSTGAPVPEHAVDSFRHDEDRDADAERDLDADPGAPSSANPGAGG